MTSQQEESEEQTRNKEAESDQLVSGSSEWHPAGSYSAFEPAGYSQSEDTSWRDSEDTFFEGTDKRMIGLRNRIKHQVEESEQAERNSTADPVGNDPKGNEPNEDGEEELDSGEEVVYDLDELEPDASMQYKRMIGLKNRIKHQVEESEQAERNSTEELHDAGEELQLQDTGEELEEPVTQDLDEDVFMDLGHDGTERPTIL